MLRLALAALLLAPSMAVAQAPGIEEIMESRSLGMGGAFTALGLGADAALANPGAMSLFKRFHVTLHAAWDLQTKFAYAGSTVVDSQTSELAGGVCYHYLSLGRGDERRFGHLSTLALGLPVSQAVHLGVSGRHIIMSGAFKANAVTMDAGTAVRVAGPIVVALSGHNLIDIANPDFRRYYALGVGYTAGVASAALDVRADFNDGPLHMTYRVGGEYIAGGAFPLRGGYSFDPQLKMHFVHGGIGLNSEGGGIDLGYRHELGGMAGRLLSLSIRTQM